MAYDAIGPLTLAAVVELVYRVKSVSYSGSITVWPSYAGSEGSDETFATGGTATLEDQPGPAASNELDQFIAAQYQFDDVDPGSISFGGTDGDGGSLFIQAITGARSAWMGDKVDIWKDENGEFWLIGEIVWSFSQTDPGIFSASIGTRDTGGTVLEVDISLVLKCGTFPIKGVALTYDNYDANAITAASLTVTATEWFPYKTTAGAAAWNTSTGAAANGGPGA